MVIPGTRLRAFNDSVVLLASTAFQGAMDQAIIAKLMMRTNAVGQHVVLAWLGALPGMQKLRGEPRKSGIRVSEYSFENFEWEDTLTVKAIDLFRDKQGVYSPMAQMLGVAGAQLPLELLGELLVNGFTKKDYTGSNFFAANKKAWPEASAFTNKGTKKLSAANYETAYTNITRRKNAFGKPMRLGKSLALVVGPTNKFVAESIVKLPKLAGGADNPYYQTAEVIVLQDIEGTGTGNEWFLLELGLPVKPFALNDEIPFRVLSDTAMDTRDYIESHDFIWQGYYSGGVGFGLPELAYGSDGTTDA